MVCWLGNITSDGNSISTCSGSVKPAVTEPDEDRWARPSRASPPPAPKSLFTMNRNDEPSLASQVVMVESTLCAIPSAFSRIIRFR